MIVLIGALMTTIITTLSLPRRCKWTLVERVPAHRITISVFYTFRKVTTQHTHAKRQFRVDCSFPTVVETPPVWWSFFFVGLKSFFISSRTTRHFTWQKKSAWIERSAKMKLFSLAILQARLQQRRGYTEYKSSLDCTTKTFVFSPRRLFFFVCWF